MSIKIQEPEVCPFCGGKIVRLLDEGAHLYCSNPACAERKLQKLNYFVTKQCMNIDGLSEKTLRKLQESGCVKEWKDLYEKTFDDFVAAGLGNKTALKLVDEIAKSRTSTKAENVLMALGIPMIGKVTAHSLMETFKSIKVIESTCKTSGITTLGSLGTVATQQLVDYINNNSEELQYVYKYLPYEYEDEVKVVAGSGLSGLTILATGTLKNFTRESIKESIISNGGKYASGVSAKLDYLLVGDAAGASKLNKAKDLGIKIITEDEYLNMIK